MYPDQRREKDNDQVIKKKFIFTFIHLVIFPEHLLCAGPLPRHLEHNIKFGFSLGKYTCDLIGSVLKLHFYHSFKTTVSRIIGLKICNKVKKTILFTAIREETFILILVS